MLGYSRIYELGKPEESSQGKLPPQAFTTEAENNKGLSKNDTGHAAQREVGGGDFWEGISTS